MKRPKRELDADVERDFREFWKPILYERGRLNLAQLKKELFDYHQIMQNVAKVYDHITCGRISKPNTTAQAVIDEADAIFQEMLDMDKIIGYQPDGHSPIDIDNPPKGGSGVPQSVNTEIELCPVCGQADIGQTGEYPCPRCGLPRTWDAP